MHMTEEQVTEFRSTLQSIKDSPQNASEQTYKTITLDGMSNPSCWHPDVVQIVWYGWVNFKGGFDAAVMAALSEHSYTGFHIAASTWMDKEQFIMVSDLKGALK